VVPVRFHRLRFRAFDREYDHFATAYLSGIAPTLGLGAIFHNLLWVSLGNAIAGAFVLAFGYTVVIRPNQLAIARRPARRSVPPA